MNSENIKNFGFTDYWIAATELKKFRRLYFTTDKIYVIKAPSDRIKMYLAVGIVVLFLLLSAFINQGIIVSGLIFELCMVGICSSISGMFIVIVIITIKLLSIDNKLKKLSPSEILNLNKDNYFINYSDISNIEFKPLPKTFLKKEGELLIVTAYGTHKLIIPDEYFEEIKDKIKKIESQMPEKNMER